MVRISDANTFGFEIKDVPRQSNAIGRLEQITDRAILRTAVTRDLLDIVQLARLFLNSGGGIDCRDEAYALLKALEEYVTKDGIGYPEDLVDFIANTRRVLPIVKEGMKMVFEHRNPDGTNIMLNAYEYG